MTCKTDCCVFTSSKSSVVIDCQGTGEQTTITSKCDSKDVGWEKTSAPSWVTIGEYGSIDAGYNSGSSRSGTIVLTQNGSGKTVSIDVTQNACGTSSCTCVVAGVVKIHHPNDTTNIISVEVDMSVTDFTSGCTSKEITLIPSHSYIPNSTRTKQIHSGDLTWKESFSLLANSSSDANNFTYSIKITGGCVNNVDVMYV